MSLTILPSTTPDTPALRCAKALTASSKGLLDATERTRAYASQNLWGVSTVNRATGLPEVQRLAAPNDILNEIAEPDQVKLMLGDVAARLLLSLKGDNPVSAFVASSPVPATERVDFKDASGDVVDVSPELGALLAKFATITGVEVVTVVHAE